MPTTLAADIARIGKNFASAREQGERNTELRVVLPIIEKLGWDRDNEDEVVLQYSIPKAGSGSAVDWALLVGNDFRVFLEAKAWNLPLTEGEVGQLSKYCLFADQRPTVACLTNGRQWRFYLPPKSKKRTPAKAIAEGLDLDPSLFLEFNLLEEPTQAAEDLFFFLSHDRLSDPRIAQTITTRAKKLIQERHDYAEAKRNIRRYLDGEHTGDIANIIADLLAEKAGTTRNLALRYISEHSLHLSPTSLETSRAKPASFKLSNDSGTHVTKTWVKLLLEVSATMRNRHRNTFRAKALANPRLFTEDVFAKHIIDKPVRGTRIFVFYATHEDAKRRCEEIVHLFEPSTEIEFGER